MTLSDYLGVLVRRWIVVALGLLLGLGGGVALALLTPSQYTATATLYVSSQSGENLQQAYQGAQLSEQRVKSYTELVTGWRVLQEAGSRLTPPLAADDLADRVTAGSELDSVLIDVTVRDTSAARSAEIADAVGAAMTVVVNDLERPRDPRAVPPVELRVVNPAVVPTAPSSAGLATYLLLGGLVGLLAGYGLALVLHVLDRSVRSSARLAEVAGTADLGEIPHSPDLPRMPLEVHSYPNTALSEAVRQIRTNLRFVDVDNPHKVVVVTSAIAGEGKTTTAANLAVALSATGERVLVVEADLRRPTLSALFGLDNSVGLTNVLAGQLPLERAVQSWNGGAVDILPSGRNAPNPSELLSSAAMRALLDRCRSGYDVVLVDSPPLLPVSDTTGVAPAADATLLVARHRRSTDTQVREAVKRLALVSVTPVGAVLTMTPRTNGSYGSYTATDVQRGDTTVPEAGGGPDPARATGHGSPVQTTRPVNGRPPRDPAGRPMPKPPRRR